jgi:predicted PurR-regulated permease PerM
MTERRVTYLLKVVMLIVLIAYLAILFFQMLAHVRIVIVMIIGAVFFTYLIYPAIDLLRKRMPLVAAVVIVYVGLLVLVGAAAWYVLPRVSEDATLVVQRYPDVVDRIHALLYDPRDTFAARMPDWLRAQLASIPLEIGVYARSHTFSAVGHLVFVVKGTFAVATALVLIPLLTAYMLLDMENLKRAITVLLPGDRWRATLEILSEIDGVIGGFVRGQIVVAITVGILITIALTLLHVRYAFLLGLLAAVGDLIPYVGAVAAFLPAFITAFVGNGIVNALLVMVAFVLVYEAEGHLLAPNIVGKTVRLSPLIVLVAVLMGAELGGMVGMLIAVPIAGVLRVLALRVLGKSPANAPPL